MAAKSTIRAFRSAVAKLKRKGLLDPSIDARSAKPTRSLERKVNELQHVINGDAVAVKLSREETRKKKEQGYRVVKPKGQPARVIIPTYEDEKVTVSHGRLTVHHKSGVQEIDIDVDVNNPESLRRWASRNKKRIDSMKQNGEAFAFKLRGYNSWDTYSSIDRLVDHLLKYDIFQKTRDEGGYFEDGIEALQILKIEHKYDWSHGTRNGRKRLPRPNKYIQEKRKLKKAPKYVQELHKQQAAERSKQFRDSMTEAQKQKYKMEAKKRAKKSRGNRKKKSK